jgi:hypothetical protein
MKNIVIFFSCYDLNSSYTARWAEELRNDLVKQKDTCCFLYDTQYLCRSSTALDDAVERADYIVFYGHGTQNSWVALPDYASGSSSVQSIPLVDSSKVGVLKGRKVYAGCCWSLDRLGNNYIASFPQGEYIGYAQEFGFEGTNAAHFKDVVNFSVRGFVRGMAAAATVTYLQSEWARLRDRLYNGDLQGNPNAVQASKVAELNRLRVGSKP